MSRFNWVLHPYGVQDDETLQGDEVKNKLQDKPCMVTPE